MSSAEQAEFRSLLEKDSGLRTMYESDRLITSTLQRDRAAIPADHSRLEQHVMSVLRGAPAATPATAPVAAGSVALAVKTISTIAVGIGIIVGGVWFLRSANAPVPAAPQQQMLQSPAPQSPVPAPANSGAPRGTLPGYDARHGERPSRSGADAAPATTERAGKADPHSMNGSAVLSSDSVDVKLKLDRNKLGGQRDN